jgi:pimeloyl-ACP methyl ester carboxylesterase
VSEGAVPVVLLHGLGRTSASLRRLARALQSQGHPTLVPDDASRDLGVAACAEQLRPVVVAFQARHERSIAFVGHSMGSLVARILAAAPDLRAKAIVMLAPPNGGSEVADVVHRFVLGRMILGPALADLRTNAAAAIPLPTCPIGVIAGTHSYMPFTRWLIAGQNDGLVSVARTQLEGADSIPCDAGHTFRMNHPTRSLRSQPFSGVVGSTVKARS